MNEHLKEIITDARWELYPKSPVPLYYQLSRILENFIQDEAFNPGDRFPPEEAIAKFFQVSRPTANRAVHVLLEEGSLSRDKGKGTFVKEKPFIEFSFYGQGLSFADHFPKDVPIRTKTIWNKIVPASGKIARSLELQAGAETIVIRRLRLVHNRPFMVCDSQLSRDKFPQLLETDLARNSLYNTLKNKFDCPIVSSERYVYAAEAVEQEILRLLEIKPFSSILVVSGISCTTGNKPIDYLTTYMRKGVKTGFKPHL